MCIGSATVTLVGTPANKHAHGEDMAPHTPNRSQSMRLLDTGKVPSEYSEQVMADLWTHRTGARSHAERSRRAMNVI